MREKRIGGGKGDYCLQHTKKKDYNQEIKEDSGSKKK
jgi:hypothetical protein